MEAHAEVGNTETLEFLGPTPENSVAGQIEIMMALTPCVVAVVKISIWPATLFSGVGPKNSRVSVLPTSACASIRQREIKAIVS